MDDPEPCFSCERDRQLFRLQLWVAQRADELTRLLGRSPGQSFELWRQAEGEIWERISSDPQARKEFAAMSDLADSSF